MAGRTWTPPKTWGAWRVAAVSEGAATARAGRLRARAGALLPGVAAVALIATAAWMLGRLIPLIGAPVLALAAGVAIRNTAGLPAVHTPGVEYTLKRLLRLAIVLFGATLAPGGGGRGGDRQGGADPGGRRPGDRFRRGHDLPLQHAGGGGLPAARPRPGTDRPDLRSVGRGGDSRHLVRARGLLRLQPRGRPGRHRGEAHAYADVGAAGPGGWDRPQLRAQPRRRGRRSAGGPGAHLPLVHPLVRCRRGDQHAGPATGAARAG